MSCLHPAGTITDHTIHGYEQGATRYAWRGACSSCQQAVVGVTSLPPGLDAQRINARLVDELMAYFHCAASVRA